MAALIVVHLSHSVGEVAARSDGGEGLGAGSTLTLVAARLDLSRKGRERWADSTEL
jgi:hypothetical protein